MVWAYAEKQGTREEIAGRFGVSLGMVKTALIVFRIKGGKRGEQEGQKEARKLPEVHGGGTEDRVDRVACQAAQADALQAVPGLLQSLCEENAALCAQIAWLKQQLFGPGKSETLDRAQLRLQLDALEQLAGRGAAEHPTETIVYERPAGPVPKRTLPAESFVHLPVKKPVEIVPEAVRADPSLYEKIGEERTFEVDVVPPRSSSNARSCGRSSGTAWIATVRRCSRPRRSASHRAASPRRG